MNKSTTARFSIVLLGIAAIATAGIGFLVVASSSDRDGLLYRIASRTLFPLTKELIATVSNVPGVPMNESLVQAPAGWTWFQPELVDASFGTDGLVMVPTREAVWWKNKRGPLLYTHVAGDFDASVAVKTRKKGQAESYPDRAYQFGGLVIRDPRGAAWLSREEYVFVAVGYRASGLQIESKSTFNGYSDVTGTDWDSGDAKLRIRRIGNRFELFAYAADTGQWRTMETFTRDLPDTVQVGLFSYAYSNGQGIVDIKVHFSDFQLQAASATSSSK